MMVHVLAALSVLCVLIPSAVSNQCSSRSNGCSIPFNLPYFYKSRFTPSCDKHDVCYSCASRYGLSRYTCDSKFKTDMRQACSRIGNRFKRQHCRNISGNYYLGVRTGGSSHFNSRNTPSWCRESWVRQCLP